MVLFVFEGKNPEDMLFGSMDSLFLHIGTQKIKCIFQTNIYQLYKEIYEQDENVDDIDTVSVLKEWLAKRGDPTIAGFDSGSFSEIYLFFDYDPHAALSIKLSLKELNGRVTQMLSLFNNETEHGKLYISYPMSEAFRYTKQLPDENYYTYTCPIGGCGTFKNDSSQFSYYKNTDFVSIDRCHNENDICEVRKNWKMLNNQNVAKANYICSSANVVPDRKEDVEQMKIFDRQLSKYIPKQKIAILSAFPLFLFDYLKPSELFE